LHIATFKGFTETVGLLLRRGAKIDLVDIEGSTAVHKAAFNKHADCLKLLLRKGAALSPRDNEGSTPLHKAAFSGCVACLSILIAKGAAVNDKDNEGSTPLHNAAYKGNVDCMQMLFDAGADPNIPDNVGLLPIHHAASNGHLQCVELLVQKNPSCISSVDDTGITPLMNAAYQGHADIIHYLVSVGASVETGDKDGTTAMHFAAIGTKPAEIMSLLCNYGLDINVKNKYGRAPIHFAASDGSTEAVNFLLDQKVDINLPDAEGNTPLHLAVQNNRHEIVGLLLRRGAKINTQNSRGQTPLHIAASQPHLYSMVLYLLSKGGALDIEDIERKTPIHVAYETGDPRLIQMAKEFERGVMEREETAQEKLELTKMLLPPNLKKHTALLRFLELLYDTDWQLVETLLDTTQQADMDKVSQALVNIFHYIDIALPLIKVGIKNEVEKTTDPGTLFRSNTMVPKMMTLYSRMVAKKYLQETLRNDIDKICKYKKSLEVDPSKMQKGQKQIDDNIKELKTIVSGLIDSICNSLDKMPWQCRQICYYLKQQVSQKYQSHVEVAIAGYLFLRLFNPAIVVPDAVDIKPAGGLTEESRRTLLLVSKILQNVSTGVEFQKEEYMLPFNPFLKEKFEIMKEFYNKAATLPPDLKLLNSDVTEVSTQKFIESVINLLHIMNSFDKKTLNDKIAQKLAETNPTLLDDLRLALTELEYNLDELQVIESPAYQAIVPATLPKPPPPEKSKEKKEKKDKAEKESEKKAKKERKMREKLEREEQEKLRKQQVKSRSISLATNQNFLEKKTDTTIKKTKIQMKKVEKPKEKKEEKKK